MSKQLVYVAHNCANLFERDTGTYQMSRAAYGTVTKVNATRTVMRQLEILSLQFISVL